jgi:uncharacterized SAM-binding protein YcdF (DUF218 family)
MSSARDGDRQGSIVLGLTVGGLIALLAHELDLRVFVSYWHDDLLPLTVLALIVGLLWRTRLRLAIGATAVLLTVLWLAAAFSPLTRHLAEGLVRRDTLQKADAVFVLSSQMQRDGDLTASSMARLVHGLELLGDGFAPRLILSELREKRPPYAAAARGLMGHLHMNAELLVVGPVGNTHDEAEAVARLCRARGWQRILLVTSPSHSRRASAVFEHAGLTIVSSPSTETRYDLESLDLPEDRVAAFGNLMHERIGLWIYKRRGWI